VVVAASGYANPFASATTTSLDDGDLRDAGATTWLPLPPSVVAVLLRAGTVSAADLPAYLQRGCRAIAESDDLAAAFHPLHATMISAGVKGVPAAPPVAPTSVAAAMPVDDDGPTGTTRPFVASTDGAGAGAAARPGREAGAGAGAGAATGTSVVVYYGY